MKPSILDGLEPKESDAKDVAAEEIVNVAPWEGTILPNNYSSITDIRNQLDSAISKNVDVKTVISNLFIYNSKVKVLTNIIGDKPGASINLLVLPEAKVIIDICNFKNDYIICKYHNAEYYINKILKNIKQSKDKDSLSLSGFTFSSLKDVQEKNKEYKAHQVKVGTISFEFDNNDGSIIESEQWRSIMTSLFHGGHNWTSELSYLHIANDLDYSLLPFQVLCYEDSSNISIEDGFCIEGKEPLKNNWKIISHYTDSEVAVFSVDKSSTPKCKLIFHGLFKLNKERSIQEGYVSFKYINGTIEV